MKGRFSLSFIFLLLLAFYLLNPPFRKHRAKMGMLPDPVMLETKTVPGIKYNDYLLFSSVTDITGQRKTFGILGFVFKS